MSGDHYFDNSKSLINVMEMRREGTSNVLTLHRIYGPWPERNEMIHKIAGSKAYCGCWFVIEPKPESYTCAMAIGGCD